MSELGKIAKNQHFLPYSLHFLRFFKMIKTGVIILAKNFDAAGEHSKYWLPPLLQTNKPLRFVTPRPPLHCQKTS